MSEFTPGPWNAYRRCLDGTEWFVKSDAKEMPPFDWRPRLNVKIPPLYPMDGLKIVDAYRGCGGVSDAVCCDVAVHENEANAHLIAAAPELYAALVEAKAELEAYEEAATGESYNNTGLNAALAKARGETP